MLNDQLYTNCHARGHNRYYYNIVILATILLFIIMDR